MWRYKLILVDYAVDRFGHVFRVYPGKVYKVVPDDMPVDDRPVVEKPVRWWN